MVSKNLTAVWALFAVCLLAAAGITIAFSVIWQMPNSIVNFVIDKNFLLAGLALGATYGVTVVVSVGAIIQPQHVTIGLVVLNWFLLFDALATVVVGTIIWFSTLTPRLIYSTKFAASTPQVQQALQDHFKCCGFMASNATVTFAGFCPNPAAAANATACVGPVTAFTDFTLNNIFTSVYGFMAVIVGLFLASVCVINKRIEAERFRKIDAKRGGKGFV